MIGVLRLSHLTSRFGYITPRGGGPDAYVHLGQLQRSGIAAPVDGLVLTYDKAVTRDGRLAAAHIKVAE